MLTCCGVPAGPRLCHGGRRRGHHRRRRRRRHLLGRIEHHVHGQHLAAAHGHFLLEADDGVAVEAQAIDAALKTGKVHLAASVRLATALRRSVGGHPHAGDRRAGAVGHRDGHAAAGVGGRCGRAAHRWRGRCGSLARRCRCRCRGVAGFAVVGGGCAGFCVVAGGAAGLGAGAGWACGAASPRAVAPALAASNRLNRSAFRMTSLQQKRSHGATTRSNSSLSASDT